MPHHTNSDQAQQVVRLYALGLSAAEVSAISDRSITTVLAILRDLGANRTRQLSARLAWRNRNVVEPLMTDWRHNHLSIEQLTSALATSHRNWFPRL